MKQVLALARETWWLWIVFLAGGGWLTYAVDGAFVITFPICVFTFFYFAFIRYDEDGKPRDQSD